MGALSGIVVVDLSRILAGPSCTQLLGDLGAEVIKVEQPVRGDDTRAWGPPFVKGRGGGDTTESAYYLCANRNKSSIAVDLSTPEGQGVIRDLVAGADVLVENFKVGGLAKYGLDYEALRESHPKLIYCSITGFGQTGPRAHEIGYDFLIQAMGGIMSITGEPEGAPMKVGLGIADVMTGMYATVGILAALRHRDATGEGQRIDLSLFDTQVSWLINAGTNYLVSGKSPARRGNAHPNIVPYQVFPAADGHFVIAVGNDGQFTRLAQTLGEPAWAVDVRFSTNARRLAHRDVLVHQISEITRRETVQHWLGAFREAAVPSGPVNDFDAVFSDPQTLARDMVIEMPHPLAEDGQVSLLGNPLKFSASPVEYRKAPPLRGEHTEQVLKERLGWSDSRIAALRQDGAIE